MGAVSRAMEPLLYKDGLCKAAGIPFPCPYPTKVLLKPSSVSSAIRFLLNHITRTYPVIYAMGGADPARFEAALPTICARVKKIFACVRADSLCF